MIQEMRERIASIVKAVSETETPVRKSNKNGLTKLNNEIVLAQVRDKDFYDDIVNNETGYDD